MVGYGNIKSSETPFSNYLLIVDAYSQIPKLCGMDRISTEEVMDKLYMFQLRSRKIDNVYDRSYFPGTTNQRPD